MTRAVRLRVAAASIALIAAAALWIRCGPLPEGMLAPQGRVSTQVVDRSGEALYEALSDEGGRSRPIAADALPPTLVAATLAAEDRRFFHHPGVDPVALARALWHDVRARRLVEGGSTITQQVVKVLIHRPRTPWGKVQEVVYALRLEHRLGKREILALYLSVAPYGNQYAGAEAAARGYFGVHADALTPAQAAFLAGLPQRPGSLNPRRDLGPALARQRVVLGRMERASLLDPQDAARARAERLQLHRDPRERLAPHFVERALAEAGDARRVETTLDASLQRKVAGILAMHRARLLDHGAWNVAVVVLDNARGEWLAWEGSGDHDDALHGGAIDGVISPRQPGSALKPFTYALAFEQGETPATVLPDLPSHFPTAVPGILYSPRNYDGAFRGPMRARVALAGSENIPAVYLLSRAGVPDLLRLLRRAGLETLDRTPDHYGFALTMGDAEVRLDQLVTAYAALARGGVYRPSRLLRAVVAADGSRQAAAGTTGERLVSERTAFWVADVLSDSDARAFAFGSGGSLDFPFPVAVKTGTSQAYRDNWTIGFTRDVTVGVWVGNFDRTPLRNSSGVTGAAPIFHDVMLAAQEEVAGRLPAPGEPTLPAAPAGLVPHTICALSGLAASRACPRVQTEWVPEGRALPSCTWHRMAGERTVVAWPPRYRAWARTRGLVDERALRLARLPGAEGGEAAHEPPRSARVSAPASFLSISNPPAGATYLKDPTLRDAFQTLPLRAVAEADAGPLTWRVDGAVVGTASPDGTVEWSLRAGEHTVSVTDARGRTDLAGIVVK